MDHRIPVTLLTGFLGAGKTTLLNAILSDPNGPRVAVIVNEFGDAGLDHDLIETSDDDITLMASGCLCCSVRGELADTMADLLTRRGAGAFDFDRVVIETTGLADPGPILQTMVVDHTLARSFRMDGVVTVVDAAHGAATLDAQFEAVSQVAMADLLVLSKCDLVSPAQITTLRDRLRRISPTAHLRHAVRGADIAHHIWNLSGLRKGVAPKDALSWLSPQTAPSDPLANLSGLPPTTPEPAAWTPHDTRIGTASIVLDTPLNDRVFDIWLDTLMSLRGSDILRVKGIVFLEDVDFPFVFHGVQQIFDPPMPLHDWPKEDRRTRIVVIARDVTRPELQRSFDMLRATLTPASEDALL